MPKAPLDEIVHRSELLPPTFGDMALGGADFTVVSFTPLLVTVDVVFWLMVLSSAMAEKDKIKKQHTIPNATALYVLLLILLDIRLLQLPQLHSLKTH